ncbi:Molybdopterin molybdenumtransferase [Madurella mycetomatis]|uniref:molybdopterin adenylyltransferase n=1 Tax=Madurella mycetomatis TaxID=100816 RepID=A0A175W2F8_9PEZI|nr:Molybdopterin molybdenumtransferase [Madurella mycetomatis]
MALAYSEAIERLLHIAQHQRNSRLEYQRHVPLGESTGGVVAHDLVSPKSIPEYDTSAMDGYAIYSGATAGAAPETPVLFRVEGILAAGDLPKELPKPITNRDGQVEPCVEIMTGAIFPECGPTGKPYDACVKVEDAVLVDSPHQGHSGRHILVVKPIAPNANKRFANSDICKGDIIISKGEAVRPCHIMTLAAVGFEFIPLIRKPRVAIFSTGRELVNGKGATRDANGPYLAATAREMGLDVDFLGIVDDDAARLHCQAEKMANSGLYDLVITSGAVSKGKFDHVRQVLEQLDAEIVFHGLAIRPGHPALFALLPTKGARKTAFFGLPGNPGAAAACFRFLTVPYLRALQGQPPEPPILARLSSPRGVCNLKSAPQTDCFRLGLLSTTLEGQLTVQSNPDHSPAKLGPFLSANCWIHLKSDFFPPPTSSGLLVECYPVSPAGILNLQPSYYN